MGKVAATVAPLTTIRPQAVNANRHTPRGGAALESSIQADGWIGAITVAADGETFDGSQRVETGTATGFTDAIIVESDGTRPVIVKRTDIPTAADPRAVRLGLAANRVAELNLSWDSEVIGATDAELLAGLWRDDELAELLAGIDPIVPGNGGDAFDATPTDGPTRVQPGDVWAIGPHRLVCGDSTDPATLELLMGGHLAQLGVTSPPYNQQIDTFRPSGMHKEGDWVAKVARLAYADNLPETEYQQDQAAALELWYTCFAEGASFFYNHKNRYRDKQVISPLSWLPGPFRFRQEIIWSRPGSVTQNARMFLPSDERIYWLYKGADFYFDDSTAHKSWSTVWDIRLEINKEHAVAFPLELPARPIDACSKPGDIVADFYLGSGTTLIAAHRAGRICYGCELSPAYCDVILRRAEAEGIGPIARVQDV